MAIYIFGQGQFWGVGRGTANQQIFKVGLASTSGGRGRSCFSYRPRDNILRCLSVASEFLKTILENMFEG